MDGMKPKEKGRNKKGQNRKRQNGKGSNGKDQNGKLYSLIWCCCRGQPTQQKVRQVTGAAITSTIVTLLMGTNLPWLLDLQLEGDWVSGRRGLAGAGRRGLAWAGRGEL